MGTNTQITLRDYMHKSDIMASFERLLGSQESEAYVQSVLIAVASNENLQDCTPQSIYRSALRSASLGLSLDPALKQAWLVGRRRKVKARKVKRDDGQEVIIPEHYEKEATFQPHYKGLYNLAMRTNKYSEIEVLAIGDGYTVETSVDAGILIIHEATGKPAITLPKCDPKKAKIWFGWFRTTRGFTKKLWKTVAEIHEHAKKYNPDGYASSRSAWQDPEIRPTMEMKTILTELLSWADLSDKESQKLAEAIRAGMEDISVEAEELSTLPEPITQESGNGTNPDPIDDASWDAWLALCHRAEKVDVPYSNVDREKTTKSDLRIGYGELLGYVKDAEYQAEPA